MEMKKRVPVTDEDRKKSYFKFYEREMAQASPEKYAMMLRGPLTPDKVLPFSERNRLFEPGYLDAEIGWCVLPAWASWAAAGVFLLAYALYAEVLRENAYLSRTIEVQEGQKVVDTGLYGVVRHPMYAVTLFLFLSMPLVLGSPISFAVMLVYIPIIVKRIRNEEAVLEKGLEGYAEYKQRVRYRLVPGLW